MPSVQPNSHGIPEASYSTCTLYMYNYVRTMYMYIKCNIVHVYISRGCSQPRELCFTVVYTSISQLNCPGTRSSVGRAPESVVGLNPTQGSQFFH